MTKEELKEKRDDEATSYAFATGEVGYKAGFDSAVALLLPRLEEAIRLLSSAKQNLLYEGSDYEVEKIDNFISKFQKND